MEIVLQIFSQAIMIVVKRRYVISNLFNVVNGIFHGNPATGIAEHFGIIVLIAECNDLIRTELIFLD